jgi:hypothetical protein
MSHKVFGKIRRVSYGYGGYQGAQFGIEFELGGTDWATGDFWGFWGGEWSQGCKWTPEEQIHCHGDIAMRISRLLTSARVQTVADLKDIPIEAVLASESTRLESWRVLTEVL